MAQGNCGTVDIIDTLQRHCFNLTIHKLRIRLSSAREALIGAFFYTPIGRRWARYELLSNSPMSEAFSAFAKYAKNPSIALDQYVDLVTFPFARLDGRYM